MQVMTFILIWLWASAAAACAYDFWYSSLGQKHPSKTRVFGAVVVALIGPPFIPFFIIAHSLAEIPRK